MSSYYAKAVYAAVTAAVTAALGLVAPSTTVWVVLTIIAAALNPLAVYMVANAEKPVKPVG